ncbi:hypothetical protein [Actinoplanes sp. NPDC026619]|uniref:SbtR family transcriptional regulator n=1 Tax=Actinoplanes sp. NPDC026619 TaxID=3155798 RepID=UPI0033D5A24D
MDGGVDERLEVAGIGDVDAGGGRGAAGRRDLGDQPIGDAIELLLTAGRTAGTIRPDAEARDVIVLISWLSRLDDTELDARGPRLLSILVDGLRA